MMDPVVKQNVEEIVHLLVRGEYEALSASTGNDRLDAAQLRKAVEDYGRTLVPLTADWADEAVVIPVDDPDRTMLAITVDLRTVEEGLSDLSLELTLTRVAPDQWKVGIDNLHVL
ncbi:DUF7668 domain-containing protein [Saccharothrix xinjiangensis]|uniref:DUF7668 domain-containing protein n=1 Tax=Saccharothrix xinjiangensis TaxID=204798 RepID=A0ABV9XXY0_9PSEU